MTATVSGDVDIFILTLVSTGLETSYDLKSRAGLSLGTTLPALDRLAANGLITEANPGPRRVRKFSVTKAGRRKLSRDWKALLERGTSTLDEILRILYIAIAFDGSHAARSFILRAVTDLQRQFEVKVAEADQLGTTLTAKKGPDWYRWLRLRAHAAELRAHASLLENLAKELRSGTSPRRRR